MKHGELKQLTGKMVKEWHEWLRTNEEGCCTLWFASTDKYRYCVNMGWHYYDDQPVLDENGNQVFGGKYNIPQYKPVYKIAWKIGRQTHNNVMQCDFDIDFEMPYVTDEMAKADPELCEGDVDDTVETVELRCSKHGQNGYRHGVPEGYRSWEALATQMRKTARRVFKDWKDHDDEADE